MCGICGAVWTDPKNALIKQYKQLFKMEGTRLEFDEEVLNLIVDKAIEFKLGARGLNPLIAAAFHSDRAA